ncbi:hypothetical protein J3R83DRAFT_11622 [Lanmaoa asiatica]|nr:hypothetical protein J3R83DRAFT_5901 [Lanmaoa asiatica]KAH0834266.1 hypothetical protein J3R83DRAFT_11622 [Lanmaoa asiatica]
MTVNLNTGNFKIISLTEGNPPIGIDYTKPAFQNVRPGGPVQQWAFRKVGPKKYRLSIGGYRFTGVHHDKVTASINHEDDVEWEFIYRKHQQAYTIALAADPQRGWTIVPEGHEIAIRPIIETHSLPPRFVPTQLFRFEPMDD